VNRAEKAERIRKLLDRYHPEFPVPLAHEAPFQLLVAVLLSAQCTDERVNKVTPGLFGIGPDAHAMAKLPTRSILAKIKSCGLAPTKAKNVRALSQTLVAKYGGRVPESFGELEALPGVGHKTASVVMNQGFGHPAFAVDTHIHRLAQRWGLSSGKNVEQTERDLKKLWPAESWGRLHLQIIYFGREHCPARGHDLAQCPICSWAATAKRMREEARKGGAQSAVR
jgi:endonuclease-3